jgi:CMP-N,N'-diacetyllegionaminic acid synthase
MKKKILAVIPVRSGSQGIKDKNIKPLAGVPLVAHAINAAIKVPSIDKLIVSTDSELYAEIAKKFGAETPFVRPAALGLSNIRLHHVALHALQYFDAQGEHFDAVLSLQATVPLIRPETICRVIDKFLETDCESVGTVSLIRHGHPYLAKKLVGDCGDVAEDILKLPNDVARYPRQVRPETYFFNGSIFLRARKLLENMDETTNCMGDKPRVVVMSEIEAINIDDDNDFQIAQFFMNQQIGQDRA